MRLHESKRLGLGCAQAQLRGGVNVLIVARGAELLTTTAIKLIADGARPAEAGALFVVTDITTTEGRSAVFAVRKDFDIMVTNAGSPPAGDFRDWGRDVWTKADDANMLTPIELIKATVDGMTARVFMQHAGGLPDQTKRAGRWWGLSRKVLAFLV